MRTDAIIFPEPFKTKTGQFELPDPKPGEVITKTIVTGVSTGTEIRVFSGKQDGSVFPLVPGYENVGEVIATGAGVTIPHGTLVWVGGTTSSGNYSRCWGAQVAHALKPAADLIPVPAGVDPLDAVYTKVGAIALHGVKRGRVNASDTVAVVGLGLIGHLAAQCAKAFGAMVIAIDTDEERLAHAKKAGVDHTVIAGREDAEKRVKELTNGGVTVAIDVTGVASTVDKTAQLVHTKPWVPPYPPSARVIILGSYTEPVAFSYIESLFRNEPDIIPSRDTVHDDLREMLGLIAAKKVRPRIIPDEVHDYRAADAAYAKLMEKKAMRILFRWK